MRLIAALSLAAGLAVSVPAHAQAESAPAPASPGERIKMAIVYGNDPCPQSSGDEITVCARKEEAERFRIPEALRESRSPQNDAWNNRVLAYEMVGRQGTLSCSPVGAGGATGCTQQLLAKAAAEKAADPNIRFSELIAEERERRLSTIDADAAAAQGRVEQAERDYEARERARQEAATPAPVPAGQ